MQIRSVFSTVFATATALAFLPVGCGGAQEDYTVVYPAHQEGSANAAARDDRPSDLDPAAQQRIQACLTKHEQFLSRQTYNLRYAAHASENGAITEIALRSTTLPDDAEGCLRQVIATLTVPEQTLRRHSSRPFSGGESMTREQRGPLGNNDSQNPIVWGLFLVLEGIEIEVSVDVIIGVFVAVGTLAMPRRKDPKKECYEKYVACQDSPLGKLQVDVHGTTVCATCFGMCRSEGAWPSGFPKAVGWQTCR